MTRQNTAKLSVIAALAVIAATVAPALANPPTKLRRFAYVIGANDGGAERVKLRYAGTDAAKVAKLLRDLGGVASSDVLMKTKASVSDIEAGFKELVPRLKAARASGSRVELVIYYSGHSDERGLLLGEQRLDYKDLRARVSAMPADVNIAILDSCASGAFTRSKGGKREAAFLVDESSKVTGYAFISSSSADEVAQESDRIAASFFTHYLISGLRGGADANRDGKVTLSEAYQFAFAETVARTESTVGGAQHPAYNMHLAGTGDVIMTDLRATNASLVVGKAVRGRLFIRDGNGALVIEINKTSSHPVELGLSPGRYAITLKRSGKLYKATIKLAQNRKSMLNLAAFTGKPLEAATARGAAPGALEDEGAQIGDDGYKTERVRVSFTPLLSIGGGGKDKTRLSFSFNVLVGRGDALRGLEVGGLVNYMDDDAEGVQVAGLVNGVGGSSKGVRTGGLGNYTGGEHRGVIVGGLFNANLGGGNGIAVGGLANYMGADYRGLQVGGLANITVGHLEGTQIAGISNYADSVRGTQIGLINTSAGRVKGLQIGLINVAEESDASIGLINVVGNGYRAAEAWASDTAAISVGVKLGAKSTYTILAAGGDRDKYQLGAGIGLHSPMGRTYFDLDATAYTLFDHSFGNLDVDLMTKLRLAIGYELGPRLAIFGGPTATGILYLDREDERLDVTPFGGRDFETDGGGVFTLTPGLFAGVRFTL